MWSQVGEKGRTWIGRIPFRGDLLESIQEFAVKENINCARVAVTRAKNIAGITADTLP